MNMEKNKLYQRRMKKNRHLVEKSEIKPDKQEEQKAEIKPKNTDTALCGPDEREDKLFIDELNEEYEKWLNAVEDVPCLDDFFIQKMKQKEVLSKEYEEYQEFEKWLEQKLK